VQGFRKHSTLLAPSVEWILLHQGDSGLSIPFTQQEQLRVLSVGANYRTDAVAQFFVEVLARGTQRSPWVLEVLGTIAAMLQPTPAIAQALCSILQTFPGQPEDLGGDVVWHRYMLAASTVLGGVSSHLHQDMDPGTMPGDLPETNHAIDRYMQPLNYCCRWHLSRTEGACPAPVAAVLGCLMASWTGSCGRRLPWRRFEWRWPRTPPRHGWRPLLDTVRGKFPVVSPLSTCPWLWTNARMCVLFLAPTSWAAMGGMVPMRSNGDVAPVVTPLDLEGRCF
jgi:hypothetical protein